MAFCKFSSEFVISNQTAVDNFFINEFLPSAPDNCVKVYLYGLYKCTNPNSFDNSIEAFANTLNMSTQDIEDAFLYWQEQGLVQVLFTVPLQIRYMPLKNVLNNTKKFKKEKYTEFNLQVQQIIENRMITPNEFGEYYTFLEAYKVQQEALIMTIQYCADLKGKNVGYAYILTVAKNWAMEGITTTEAVEERIKMLNQRTSDVGTILKACGIKRLATIEEQERFIKWTDTWGFTLDTILFVAKKMIAKGSRLGFERIEIKLGKYYELKKLSIQEIEEYEEEKTQMFDLAREISKAIGVYYENLENVIEVYVSKWLDLGHTKNSLLMLANFCFKSSIRTLQGLDTTILKLYKLGIVSEDSIEEYISDLISTDNELKDILNRLGLSRNVIAQDREFLKTWKFSWFMPDSLIDLAVQKATGKHQPLQYVNKLLSTWASKNIKTVEEAEKQNIEWSGKYSTTASKKPQIEKEDLSALFDSLEEIQI